MGELRQLAKIGDMKETRLKPLIHMQRELYWYIPFLEDDG